MALPELTEEERMQGLEKAKEARTKRAEWRKKLATGEVTVRETLECEDPAIQRMPVQLMIRSVPGLGPAKTKKLMKEMHIAPNRRIKGLGCRQKAELARRFEGWN